MKNICRMSWGSSQKGGEENYRLKIGLVSSSLHLQCRVYVGDEGHLQG